MMLHLYEKASTTKNVQLDPCTLNIKTVVDGIKIFIDDGIENLRCW